jgi:hypothetical protein
LMMVCICVIAVRASSLDSTRAMVCSTSPDR